MEKKPCDCEVELRHVWKTVDSFSEEISKEEQLNYKKLCSLANRLTDFENILNEEYVTIVPF